MLCVMATTNDPGAFVASPATPTETEWRIAKEGILEFWGEMRVNTKMCKILANTSDGHMNDKHYSRLISLETYIALA